MLDCSCKRTLVCSLTRVWTYGCVHIPCNVPVCSQTAHIRLHSFSVDQPSIPLPHLKKGTCCIQPSEDLKCYGKGMSKVTSWKETFFSKGRITFGEITRSTDFTKPTQLLILVLELQLFAFAGTCEQKCGIPQVVKSYIPLCILQKSGTVVI